MMKEDLEKIKPIHKIVAFELAAGASLKSICDTLSLNYSTWAQITTKPLFKEAIKEFGERITQESLDILHEDPFRIRLVTEQRPSLERVISERDEMDRETVGATSATRLDAAKTLLKMGGNLEPDIDRQAVINIQLAPETFRRLETEASNKRADIPADFVLADL